MHPAAQLQVRAHIAVSARQTAVDLMLFVSRYPDVTPCKLWGYHLSPPKMLFMDRNSRSLSEMNFSINDRTASDADKPLISQRPTSCAFCVGVSLMVSSSINLSCAI